jgi:hypothetical protein
MKITEENVRKLIREELLALFEQDEAKPKSIDQLEFKSDDRVEYERWAKSNGHVSPEVQSTLVSYFLNQGLENSHDLHEKLCDELGLNHESVMAAMEKKLVKEQDPETEESARELDLATVAEAINQISKL